MPELTLYRTTVALLPATPMGLLPERWHVEHWCQACTQQIATEDLVTHAALHATSRAAS